MSQPTRPTNQLAESFSVYSCVSVLKVVWLVTDCSSFKIVQLALIKLLCKAATS